MTQFIFAPLTVETAPHAARPLLAASVKQFGFLPSPVAKAARSPALLKHLLAGFGAFDSTTLSPMEREVVAFAVAFEIECHYCMALHTALLAGAPESAAFVEALRGGTPLSDARLEALRRFAQSVVRARGKVPADVWVAFRGAGYGEEQALDVALGVGVYLLSTLTNVVVGAELDAPFRSFEWHPPRASET